MSKKQEDTIGLDTLIEDDLLSISTDITKLSKSTKLKEILKKNKAVKLNIDKVTEKIQVLKKSFETEIEESELVVSDEIYEKYSKEISSFVELDMDDLQIDQMIKKYKSITKKIQCCETYLKSKKMDLIDCDNVKN